MTDTHRTSPDRAVFAFIRIRAEQGVVRLVRATWTRGYGLQASRIPDGVIIYSPGGKGLIPLDSFSNDRKTSSKEAAGVQIVSIVPKRPWWHRQSNQFQNWWSAPD